MDPPSYVEPITRNCILLVNGIHVLFNAFPHDSWIWNSTVLINTYRLPGVVCNPKVSSNIHQSGNAITTNTYLAPKMFIRSTYPTKSIRNHLLPNFFFCDYGFYDFGCKRH